MHLNIKSSFQFMFKGHGNRLCSDFLNFNVPFRRSKHVPIIYTLKQAGADFIASLLLDWPHCEKRFFFFFFFFAPLSCLHDSSGTRLVNSSHTHLCCHSCTDPALCSLIVHCAQVFYPYVWDGTTPHMLYISKLQSLHRLMAPPRAPTTNICLP